MSSYLNAVKSGKSATSTLPVQHVPEKPPPSVAPTPQDDEDVLEDDPIDGEEEPFVDTGYSSRGNKKSTGQYFSRIEFANEKKDDEFWRLFVITSGPAGLCSFGLTCTYFFDKFLTTPDWWNLVVYQLPPFIKPVVNILVETSFTQNAAGQEKILTLPITSLKQPYQKQNVVDYWMKILTKAEKEREKDKNKDPTKKDLDANLNGGVNIETGTGKNSQTIVYLQDLSVVHSLLHAIGQLILNRKTHHLVKLPYRNGNIILSLYGRGGTFITLQVKSGKDNIRSIFPLEDFANQCRKAAKKFVSLVGYCHVYLRRPANEEIQKENWILTKLEHDCLNGDVTQIRNKLASGLVPDSLLPAHFQKKIIISKKKQDQDQIENSDIMDLILENLPENWKQAEEASDRLLKAAIEQRETERSERQARREREKLDSERKRNEEENKKNEDIQGEVQEHVPKKTKTKVITKKDKEGWVSTTVIDEAGKELEKPKPEEKPPKPKKQQQQQSKPSDSNTTNIFKMADEMDNVPSLSEYQSSLRESKLKGKEQEQKPPKNKPQRKQPVENKENGEKQDLKKSGQKKEKKAVNEKKKVSHNQVKDVPFWQNDLFRPLVYVFLFVTLISVLYLTLN